MAASLLAGLSGCLSHGSASAGPVPALEFPVMSVTTVPLEPLEGRGVLVVAWQDGRMGVSTLHEGGMPPQAVVAGPTLYESQAGMAWTSWSRATYAQSTARGFRYLAWDAPTLLAQAHVTTATATWFHATSSYTVGDRVQPVTLDVNHTGATVVDIRIATPQDPESPYTLRPAGAAFPFPMAVPAVFRPAPEVTELDGKARDGHGVLLGLVAAYGKDHGGTLPDTLTPDSLRVEMVSSGAQWPTDPYDDQPLHERVASGHFHWVHCSLGDGLYEGYGWDGPTVRFAFGRGCS